ncbi:MAG: transposase [Gammaproteobacteria bacterium]
MIGQCLKTTAIYTQLTDVTLQDADKRINGMLAKLRLPAKAHPKIVYDRLIQCAVSTLRSFGLNKKDFHAELGLCAVLQTHTRRLDYHPHVHIAIPGGGVHRERREWRKVKGDYLFNGTALAVAFRGAFINALSQAGLNPGTAPQT